MKKVFQTIVDKEKGNCMQAAIASLYETELNEVPNFIEYDADENTSAHQELWRFMNEKGHCYLYINRDDRNTTEFMKKIAKFDGGINGYFIASIKSQTFDDVYHAVVIDTNLNIVHDPNPNQLSLKLTPDDVEGFVSAKDIIIGSTGKLFTKEEWNNASKEEKNNNTHKPQKNE